MHSNRFIIKEELSVSDTVLKITDEIYHQILNRLKSGKFFISKQRNVLIKKGIFDYQSAGKLKNIPYLKVKYVVYHFNNEQERKNAVEYDHFIINSSADYKNKTINLYLSMINNQPGPDFKSDIQHEVNHIFQYDNGQQKNEDFYSRIIDLSKTGNKLDKIIARAMYYTMKISNTAKFILKLILVYHLYQNVIRKELMKKKVSILNNMCNDLEN